MTSEPRRRVLLDTNVLIDAVDPRERDRAVTAGVVLEYAARAGLAVVSTQVIAEYFDVTTRPKGGLAPIFTRADAERSVQQIMQVAECVDVTRDIVKSAMRLAVRHQIRIYDAQLAMTARANRIPVVLSADTPGGRSELEGVRYVNPFEASFKLLDLTT